MNGPRRVQRAGAGCPRAPRPRVPARPRPQGRTPMRRRLEPRRPIRRLHAFSPPAGKPRSPVGFPSRRPGLTIHAAKVPEGSQTQSESTLTLPSDCPKK